MINSERHRMLDSIGIGIGNRTGLIFIRFVNIDVNGGAKGGESKGIDPSGMIGTHFGVVSLIRGRILLYNLLRRLYYECILAHSWRSLASLSCCWQLYMMEEIIIYFLIPSITPSILSIYINIIIVQKMDVDFEEQDTFHKMIVIGDAGVGKTNMIYTFDKGRKPTAINPTIGVQFTPKTVRLPDGRKIRAQVWDTAGQEQFRALTMNMYRGAVGALIVFDVNNHASFEHVKQWFGAIGERAEASVQVGLVGHKSDSSRRTVSRQEGQKFAQKHNIFYAQSTINEPQSIRNIFYTLFSRVLDTQKKEAKGTTFKLDRKQDQNGGCSC